jgi:hypothetical protein
MLKISRRHFLSKLSTGIGGAAVASMLPKNLFGASSPQGENLLANFTPKAKRVIYLFMAGGPAQQDLFDYKPKFNELNGQALPEHVRGGQRLTGMSGKQAILPLAGSQIAGRPSLGSWVTYGLGSSNENLPGFIVLATKKPTDHPLYARLWGTGFLDSRFQGVRFSSGSDAVFYLTNPDGVRQSGRRALLDRLSALNQLDFQNERDPEIDHTRLTHTFQGRRFRLTDVHGHIVKDLLA